MPLSEVRTAAAIPLTQGPHVLAARGEQLLSDQRSAGSFVTLPPEGGRVKGAASFRTGPKVCLPAGSNQVLARRGRCVRPADFVSEWNRLRKIGCPAEAAKRRWPRWTREIPAPVVIAPDSRGVDQ